MIYSFSIKTNNLQYIASLTYHDNQCLISVFDSCNALVSLAENNKINCDLLEFKQWEAKDNKIIHAADILFDKVSWVETSCSMNGEMTPCWGDGKFYYESMRIIPVENGEQVEMDSQHKIITLKRHFKQIYESVAE
jgi:hypothetical protein